MTPNPFAPFLFGAGTVVLDGGLATELEARGHRIDSKLWSAKLLADDPEAIRSVHLAYLRAGADCITTASYQASFEGFAAAGVSDGEAVALLRLSSELARSARDEIVSERLGTGTARPTALVAASVGPYGAYLADGSEYDGRYRVGARDLDRFHRRRFDVLASTGVDLIACETVPSHEEADVLLDILADHGSAWAWMSFSCRDAKRLHDGTPIERAVTSCAGHPRVAAVGVNCTAPRHVPELIARARSVTDLPLIVYPNSGERYDATSGTWNDAASPGTGPGTPSLDDWIGCLEAAVDAGADIVGGCCRVGPRAIAALRSAVDGRDWSRHPTDGST